MTTSLHRLSFALPLLLALGGCSILGSGGHRGNAIFAPEVHVAADPSWPSVHWQLSTTPPTAAAMLDSSRIVVRPVPGQLQVYKGARWARTPGEMLEDDVLQTLEDSGRIPAVARQGSGIGADYRLVMDIRHFEADYAGAAMPSAVVEVNVQLLHLHDQAVVGSHTFREVQPAAATDVATVTDAFTHALDAACGDIAGWVLTTGQAHERVHPSGDRD